VGAVGKLRPDLYFYRANKFCFTFLVGIMEIRFKIITILLMIFFFTIVSCDNMFDIHIIGRYYLSTIDGVEEQMGLQYRIDYQNTVGVVGEKVFAVGFNEKYIIAKQHPPYHNTIINYFIVPIYKEYTYWPEKGVIGPLTLEKFNEKRKELQISDDVKFSIDIEKKKIF
jgi:hypothetical protein